MRKTIGRAFLSLFYVFILCLVFAVFAPWNIWIAAKIESQMALLGVKNPALSIDQVGLSNLKITDFSAGDDLSAAIIDATYSLDGLQQYRAQNIEIDQAHITMAQGEGGWSVAGYNPPASGNATFPPMPQDIKNLPFDTLSIANSHLKLLGVGWSGDMPFSANINNDLMFFSHAVSFAYGEMKFNIAGAEVALSPHEDGGWRGTWKVSKLDVSDGAHFNGSGDLTVSQEVLTISGSALDKANQINISFAFEYPFAKPEAAKLKIIKASMPWGNGLISTSNAIVSILAKGNITMPVYINKVSVDEVMKIMTGEYVKATGTISGHVPVIIDQGGNISLGKGSLKADQDGSLFMPPDVIPGGGQQIEMTRDILKNFNYNQLQVDISEEGADEIAILLALKGSNPNVQNGRAVHLNVRLGGDVLEFIRSNVIMVTQPETLFRQEKK
ncbi:MAG: intermembrane phospholipid transport protein YdbH family protein [Alcanivorax sp.]